MINEQKEKRITDTKDKLQGIWFEQVKNPQCLNFVGNSVEVYSFPSKEDFRILQYEILLKDFNEIHCNIYINFLVKTSSEVLQYILEQFDSEQGILTIKNDVKTIEYARSILVYQE